MIIIKVFGTTPPCVKCKEMEKRANNAAAKYPGKVEVVKFDALSGEGDKYGVMSALTLVMNDRVVVVGKVPSESELEKMIKKEMETSS